MEDDNVRTEMLSSFLEPVSHQSSFLLQVLPERGGGKSNRIGQDFSRSGGQTEMKSVQPVQDFQAGSCVNDQQDYPSLGAGQPMWGLQNAWNAGSSGSRHSNNHTLDTFLRVFGGLPQLNQTRAATRGLVTDSRADVLQTGARWSNSDALVSTSKTDLWQNVKKAHGDTLHHGNTLSFYSSRPLEKGSSHCASHIGGTQHMEGYLEWKDPRSLSTSSIVSTSFGAQIGCARSQSSVCPIQSAGVSAATSPTFWRNHVSSQLPEGSLNLTDSNATGGRLNFTQSQGNSNGGTYVPNLMQQSYGRQQVLDNQFLSGHVGGFLQGAGQAWDTMHDFPDLQARVAAPRLRELEGAQFGQWPTVVKNNVSNVPSMHPAAEILRHQQQSFMVGSNWGAQSFSSLLRGGTTPQSQAMEMYDKSRTTRTNYQGPQHAQTWLQNNLPHTQVASALVEDIKDSMATLSHSLLPSLTQAPSAHYPFSATQVHRGGAAF